MLFRTVVPVILVSLASLLHGSNPVTNYKSGISVDIVGDDGKDYVFERWYGDPLIDDHGVIYIRSSAEIRLTHNDRNINQTNNPAVGTIRYKVDQDLSYHSLWSTRFVDLNRYPFFLLPAYEKPLKFDEMHYGPEHPDMPVLGSTGPVPGTKNDMSIRSYKEHWYRGLTDSAGDEWHTLTVGDDDTELMEGGKPVANAIHNMRLVGSDGKIHYFVVNPKTPAIWMSSTGKKSQWYTTPPKAYFIPKLHDQVSYVTDGVTINLTNISTDDAIFYRIDGGEFTAYTAPIPSDKLSDGEHLLECYFTKGVIRKRKIVKNPGFPSDKDRFADGSKRGYLLWENDEKLEKLRGRMFTDKPTPVKESLRQRYSILVSNHSQWGNGRTWFDEQKYTGKRLAITPNVFPLSCALIARLEGIDKRPEFAKSAKEMLLENELLIDPVGYELEMNFSVIPSHRERVGLGYYNGKTIMSLAHAYDLLIDQYRAPAYPDGFTPIEDLKIRDMLASSVLLSLHDRQGMLWHPGMGITMASRSVYAMITAMAMPSYNTPYYGTSGFDGAEAISAGLPFPDQAATWKELFYLNNQKPSAYPNQVFGMNILATENNIALPYLPGREITPGQLDGNIREDGISFYPSSSIAYNSFHQMGTVFAAYSNTLRIKPGHGQDLAYLDRYYLACLESRQPPDKVHNQLTGYYPNPLVLNERHPDIAKKGMQKLFFEGEGIWKIIGTAGAVPYCIVWINDDWQNAAPTSKPHDN